MNPETERILKEKWPHIADDVIAVDSACDRFLKRRYRLKKERYERIGFDPDAFAHRRDDRFGDLDGR